MSDEIPTELPVPIEDDAAYWRKMYEELLALQEDGFAVLLADRDRARSLLAEKDAELWRVEKQADELADALIAKDAEIERLREQVSRERADRNAHWASALADARARWVEQLQSDEAVQAATDAWPSRESSRWLARMRAAEALLMAVARVAALLADKDAEIQRLRGALHLIAQRPSVERNPDGADQAAAAMQLIAREALGMSTDDR